MRLSEHETKTIVTTAKRLFGADASVWLFGSRVDDERRGGDIDLMVVVEHPVSNKPDAAARFAASLQLELGDQKIDVIIDDGRNRAPVHHVVATTGQEIRC